MAITNVSFRGELLSVSLLREAFPLFPKIELKLQRMLDGFIYMLDS
jgi:hypothetical protein